MTAAGCKVRPSVRLLETLPGHLRGDIADIYSATRLICSAGGFPSCCKATATVWLSNVVAPVGSAILSIYQLYVFHVHTVADIKLYAGTKRQITHLVTTVQSSVQYIKLDFGVDKSRALNSVLGRRIFISAANFK